MIVDLSGHTLLITGGHGGIGSAICERFAESGARVVAPSSREMDLASEALIRDYISGLARMPDIVIHSAGINELAGIEDLDMDVVQRVYEVNLFSFMRILHYVVPTMRKNRFGRIVGISSLYGIVSRENRIPYSSSKHAMRGLIQSLALETAKNNIMVNGVAPGYVMTDMTRKNLSNSEIQVLKTQIPTGRMQDADEIAALCCFLCSGLNRSITGQVISVDGGFLCR